MVSIHNSIRTISFAVITLLVIGTVSGQTVNKDYTNNEFTVSPSNDNPVAIWTENGKETKQEYSKKVKEFSEAEGGSISIDDSIVDLKLPKVLDDGELNMGDEIKFFQDGEEINYEDEDNIKVIRGSNNHAVVILNGDVGKGEDKIRSEDTFKIPKEYNPPKTFSSETTLSYSDYLSSDSGEIFYQSLKDGSQDNVIVDTDKPLVKKGETDVGKETTKLNVVVEKNGESPIDSDLVEDSESVEDYFNLNPSPSNFEAKILDESDTRIVFELSFDSLETSDSANVEVSKNLVEDQAGNKNEKTVLDFEKLYRGDPKVTIEDKTYENSHGDSKLVDGDTLKLDIKVEDIYNKLTADLEVGSEFTDNPKSLDLDGSNCDEYCSFDETVDLEFDGSTNGEVDVTATVEDERGNKDTATDTASTKSSFTGPETATLEGSDGKVERANIESDEELENNPSADGWKITIDREDEDPKEITDLDASKVEGNTLKLDIQDSVNVPLESNSEDIDVTYDSSDANLKNKYGIPIGNQGEDSFTEIDQIKPAVEEVHWREGMERFALEFTEPIDSFEVTECGNCGEYRKITANQADTAIVSYDNTLGSGYDTASIGVDIEGSYKDGEEVSISKDSYEFGDTTDYMPIRDEVEDRKWDLISVSGSNEHVDLSSSEKISQSFYFDATQQEWEPANRVIAERGIYVNAEEPLILPIKQKGDNEKFPDVPESQQDVEEGFNLISPVSSSDNEYERTTVNWFNSLSDDIGFVSDIISVDLNTVFSDLNGLDTSNLESCFEDGDWDSTNQGCSGKIVSQDWNVYDGYWVDVEE